MTSSLPAGRPEFPTSKLLACKRIWLTASWVYFGLQAPFPVFAMVTGGSIILFVIALALAGFGSRALLELAVLLFTRSVFPQIDEFLIKEDYAYDGRTHTYTQHFVVPTDATAAAIVKDYFEARKSGMFRLLIVLPFCLIAFFMALGAAFPRN